MMNIILDIVWAVVSVSAGFLYKAPDYESALDSQLLMGTLVQIDGTSNYWCHVNAVEPEYSGWVNELQLSRIPSDSVEAYICAPKYICTEEITRVWEEPSVQSGRIAEVVLGDILRRTGEAQGRFVQVLLPDGRKGWMLRSSVTDFTRWAETVQPSAEGLESVARTLLGVPYMWGGASAKGVDCSGLTRTAYFMNGILLPRDAGQQVKIGEPLPLDMECWEKGDLLFFGISPKNGNPARITHVAMYLGDGKIIHSSQVVRINSLVPGEPDYYEKNLVAVRRMLGTQDRDGGPVSVKFSKWYFPQ